MGKRRTAIHGKEQNGDVESSRMLSHKSIEDTEAKLYMIALDNSEVHMRYDLVVNFSMQKNKNDKVLITADYVEGTYEMENANFYKKVVEIIKERPI